MELTVTQMDKVWRKTLEIMQDKMSGDSDLFNTLFDGSYIYACRGSQIDLYFKTMLAVTLMRTQYFDMINNSLSDVLETNFTINIIGPDDLDEIEKEQTKVVKQKANYFPNSSPDPRYTFDNFVIGDFNKEASQAALYICSHPGKMFNPLFIHSPSGLGKTHLMHAIGNSIVRDRNPNAKIIYIEANSFVEECVKYIKENAGDLQSIKDYLSGFDVLLFDDVQFLANKPKIEEIFFFVYQNFVNNNKQVVITSDKQPAELSNLEDRLVSRFSQGLTVKIKEPDEPTCENILKKKIESNGLRIERFDPEVISFFAKQFSKNVRELEGALNRLIFYSINLTQSERITLEVASEAVSTLIGGKSLSSQINEQRIVNIVADYYNLAPSQLVGKIRTGQIVLARHVAMYLIKDVLDATYKQIGKMFGGKDHSTVISALRKVETELKTDTELQEAVEELRRRIKA